MNPELLKPNNNKNKHNREIPRQPKDTRGQKLVIATKKPQPLPLPKQIQQLSNEQHRQNLTRDNQKEQDLKELLLKNYLSEQAGKPVYSIPFDIEFGLSNEAGKQKIIEIEAYRENLLEQAITEHNAKTHQAIPLPQRTKQTNKLSTSLRKKKFDYPYIYYQIKGNENIDTIDLPTLVLNKVENAYNMPNPPLNNINNRLNSENGIYSTVNSLHNQNQTTIVAPKRTRKRFFGPVGEFLKKQYNNLRANRKRNTTRKRNTNKPQKPTKKEKKKAKDVCDLKYKESLQEIKIEKEVCINAYKKKKYKKEKEKILNPTNRNGVSNPMYDVSNPIKPAEPFYHTVNAEPIM